MRAPFFRPRAVARIAALVAGVVFVISAAMLWRVGRVVGEATFRDRLAAGLSQSLGRDVTVDEVTWRGLPLPSVRVRGLRVMEEDGSVLMECPSVEMVVAPRFGRGLGVWLPMTTLSRPRVRLVRDAAGWNIGRLVSEARARAATAGPARISLLRITVEEGDLEIVNAVSGSTSTVLRLQGAGTMAAGGFSFHLSGTDVADGVAAAVASGEFPGDVLFQLRGVGIDTARRWFAVPEGFAGRFDGDVARREGRWGLRVRLSSWSVSNCGMPVTEVAGALTPAEPSSWTFVVSSQDADIAASAEMGPWGERRLVTQTTVVRADLARTIEWAHALINAVPASTAPWNLSGSVSASSVAWRGEMLAAVARWERPAGAPLGVREFRGTGLGGAFTGTAVVSTAGGARYVVAESTATGLDIARIARVAGGAEGRVSGRVSGTATLSLLIGAEPLSTLEGGGTLWVEDGLLIETPGVLAVLGHLNLTSLIREAKGRDAKPLRLSSAPITVEIRQGVATPAAPVLAENETVQIAYKGSVDLGRRRWDGVAAVNVLTLAGEIVDRIPLVNIILLGGKKSMIPILVRVRGPWADPDLSVMGARSIGSSVGGIFRRILRLPATLVGAGAGDN